MHFFFFLVFPAYFNKFFQYWLIQTEICEMYLSGIVSDLGVLEILKTDNKLEILFIKMYIKFTGKLKIRIQLTIEAGKTGDKLDILVIKKYITFTGK